MILDSSGRATPNRSRVEGAAPPAAKGPEEVQYCEGLHLDASHGCADVFGYERGVRVDKRVRQIPRIV